MLGKLLTQRPIIVILIFLIMTVGFITGAAKMNMATGNETLMNTSTDAYKDNEKLESYFGGESIIVLNTSEEDYGIMTVDNFNRMKELEESLSAYDEIYTFISPASMVEQMTAVQSGNMLKNVGDIREGLQEMGEKLVEAGSNMQMKAADSPPAPDMNRFLDGMKDMNAAFEKLIQGQQKLSTGMQALNGGYGEFASKLQGLSGQIERVGIQLSQMEEMEEFTNPEALKLLKQSQMMSGQISGNVEALAGKMEQISKETKPMTAIPKQTAAGLTNMQNGLNEQTSQLDGISGKENAAAKLSELAGGLSNMGNKLLEVSGGLETLISYSDMMHPGLPGTQSTLDKLLYDEGEALRPVFKELIPDKNHSLIMIKLKGGTEDSVKEEIIGTIKEQLKQDPFDGAETIVTGKPVMDAAIRSSMQESMKKMIGIAVVLMILVLMIVFPVRWRILAIPVILLAVLATLGLMGHVGVPMTMVSMAVFPILIGLGVDYAIQFQNRYEEELEGRGEDA